VPGILLDTYLNPHIDHGWPWTFIRRGIADADLSSDPSFGLEGDVWDYVKAVKPSSLWTLNRTVEEIRWSCLAGDVLTAAIILAVGAGLFELRRRRTRLFQVRAVELIGLSVLLSIGLICLAAQIQQRRQEQYALKRLVYESYQTERAGPHWLRQLIGPRWFRVFDHVADLYLHEDGERPELLSSLQYLRAIHCKSLGATRYLERPDRLEVLDCFASDPQLDGIRRMPNLQVLLLYPLDEQEITNRGLANLTGLSQLRMLYLHGTGINDEGLAYLAGLSRLQILCLPQAAISDSGLIHLHGLTRLRYLDLQGTKVSDVGLEHIGGLKCLNYLDLHGARVVDGGLTFLDGLGQLRSLDLSGTLVSDAGLKHIEGLTQLQYLELNGTRLTDAGMTHLKGLTRLRHLELSDTKVGDAGLAPLKGLTELIQLDLKGTNVSDASLECLKGFNRLGVLHVEKSRMSEEGVTKLKQSLPDCHIWIKE
jgi:Leucine-rich repeat (LRR) protein